MKFIKLYGPKRSCTNYMKWVVEANFEDCTVLMRILGSKHSAHTTEVSWEAEEFLDPSVDRKFQLDYLEAVLPQVQAAWNSGEIRYLIVTKHPLACALGSMRRWQEERCRFEREPETWIRDYATEWNDTHSSWLALCDDDVGTLVRCEDMYNDFAAELDRLAAYFELQPSRNDGYVLPRKKLNALSDATWRNVMLRRQHDNSYILEDRYFDEWTAEHQQLWREVLDRQLLDRLGYQIASGKRGARPLLADVVEFQRNDSSVRLAVPSRHTDPIQRAIAEEKSFYQSDLLAVVEPFVDADHVVLDVGAHIGNHTVFFASQCAARVIAVESDPSARAVLERQLVLNELGDRVEVRAPGTGTALRLDDLELPAPPRLVRLGATADSLELLHGAAKLLATHRPFLTVECPTEREFTDVVDYLAERGYAVHRVVGAQGTAVFLPLAADLGKAALRASNALQYALHDLEQVTSAAARGGAERDDQLRNLLADQARRTLQVQDQIEQLVTVVRKQRRSADELNAKYRDTKARMAENQRIVESLDSRLAQTADRLKAMEISQRRLGAALTKLQSVERDVQNLVDYAALGLGGRLVEPWLRRVLQSAVISPLDTETRFGRKTQKLLRDPDAFFDDSSNEFVRDVLGPRIKALRERSAPILDRGERAVGTARVERLRRKGRKLLRNPAGFFSDSSSALLRRAAVGDRKTRRGQLAGLAAAGTRVRRTRPDRDMRAELALPSQSFILAEVEPAALATGALPGLVKSLPTDAELIVVTHATDLATFGRLLQTAAPIRCRLYFHYDIRERSELVQYGIDRAAAPRHTVVDASNEPLRPASAAYLRNRRAALAGSDPADDIERIVASRAQNPETVFDVYSANGTRIASALPAYVIGEPPPVNEFRFASDDDYFIYRGPPGDVVCAETKPLWYDPAAAQELAKKKVSVIMTVFDAVDTVEQAIESVLAQTHNNLELIVVDDCSKDGSFEVVQRLANYDRRIRVMQSPSNRGTYWCKNLGLTYATGEYVTFHDSDDTSGTHRIELQLAALHAFRDRIAVTGRYQRITPDGEVIRIGGNTDRQARITTMFHRSNVLHRFGYFDSVRVSADDELLHRMEAAGARPLSLPNTVYFARHVAGSLTTSETTSVVALDGSRSMSPARRDYWSAAEAWHTQIRDRKSRPHMPFPLVRRPFPAPPSILPDPREATSANETITASMATIPSRVDALEQTISSLLPQVDQLNVFLNEFDNVPSFLQQPKIRVARSQDVEDLKDNGKFYFLDDVAPGYHFTVDDDILYPPNYVQRTILTIEAYDRRAVVGVHGVNLADPMERFLQDREVLHFKEALDSDRIVHLIGTGTAAYHTSTLDLKFEQFETKGIADLWFAIAARSQGVPLIAQRRPNRWLEVIPVEGPNLYRTHLADDSEATRIATAHGPWRRDELSGAGEDLVRHILDRYPPARLRAARLNLPECYQSACSEVLRFALIIPGWNCAEEAEACWRSIVRQAPGPFEWEAHILDDASDDDTWSILQSLPPDDRIHLHRSQVNYGPAYSRFKLIRLIQDPDAICVLLDLDDELAPNALLRVAERYIENPQCKMTLGDWVGDEGKRNPLDFYTRDTIDAKTFRLLRKFRCPHLRTFRRSLADGLSDEQFRGPDGDWLRYCTDLALLIPLLEKCGEDEVEHIREVLYIYNERRGTGTLQRFGGTEKAAMHEWLCRRTLG